MGAAATVSPEQTGTLFVVSLPVGDPEDITLRALRILRSASLIVAEDSAVTRRFLDYYQLATDIVSQRPRYGNPAHVAGLERLSQGREVALVADCGTPALVDPGLGLIQAALHYGHRVTAVPGASACLAALVISGMPTTPFAFLGYPPRRDPERTEFFARLSANRSTFVLYETPLCLRSTLTELGRRLGENRKIVAACDITHTKERIFRGTISEAVSWFQGNRLPGAITLVIAGTPPCAVL